jgi:hypothetical protein
MLQSCQQLGYTASNGRMNDELEKIWKEPVLASSSFYAGICMEVQRKTIKNFSQDNR